MDAIESRTMAKVSRRLIPFVIICYFVAYLDRVNLSFAALEMNKDLKFTSTVYGLGAGMFFVSYFLLETPSNLVLLRMGARRWIARIMFTWGILSGAMAFIWSDTSFYVVRFLFGAAEAGFFPGILFYLTLYFPAAYRARMVSMYMVAIPVSAVIGAPLSTSILYMDGVLGLRGWQWIFISEAIPALILSVVTWFYMTETPAVANWLAPDERDWLVKRQAAEVRQIEQAHGMSVWQVIRNPRVLALGLAGYGIANEIYGLTYFLPQIVKQFGLSNMQTGLVSAIPFAVGAVGMIWYGRRSDRLLERRSHTAVTFLITAIGLTLTALTPNPYFRLLSLCIASFGAFSSLPVFWSMPTAFLSGAAAAAGVAYINSIANIAGFLGNYLMGWLRDVTGSYDSGLLAIAAVCNLSAFATLCIHHDKELEQTPILDDTAPMPGNVAEIV
jgi:ACS family tartrate transporter-like MFS transporter